ncbi:hypothetical protein CHS0354_001067 [Potamilus streckersoni]|uniref:Uncharacterized protein n=1 Tax=Potamilus streckersoni TaxID=2493646 RepID=A0AAE0W1R1_9BIVA|nr:hypothetical protein CHS0354_001067 [Potamilus streckersoni]
MNGINLRYKTIEDPDFSISIKLRDFIFFKNVAFCQQSMWRAVMLIWSVEAAEVVDSLIPMIKIIEKQV